MLESVMEHVNNEPNNIPVVFQYNYTEQEGSESKITPEELDQILNSLQKPSFTIKDDKNVLEPLKEIVKQVFAKMD